MSLHFRDSSRSIVTALARRELGSRAAGRGDLAAARGAFDASVALFRQTGDERGLAQALLGLGRAMLQAGALEEARGLFGESLKRWRDLGLRVGILRNIAGLGEVAAAQGRLGWATILAAAAAEAADESALLRLRAGLGEAAYASAWATGQAMSLDEAIARALDSAVA
jgi:hypothetical protein